MTDRLSIDGFSRQLELVARLYPGLVIARGIALFMTAAPRLITAQGAGHGIQLEM